VIPAPRATACPSASQRVRAGAEAGRQATLHDGVVQRLAAVTFSLSPLARRLASVSGRESAPAPSVQASARGRVSLRALGGRAGGAGAVGWGDVSLLRVRNLAASLFGSPWVRLTGSVIAVALFVHGVDLPQALRLYGNLVPGWVLLAVGLAALSVVASVAE
jgi:hypothetical protein